MSEGRNWRVVAGDVLFALRPTREEAEDVVETQYDLAKKFGLPVRVEPPIVTDLRKETHGIAARP